MNTDRRFRIKYVKVGTDTEIAECRLFRHRYPPSRTNPPEYWVVEVSRRGLFWGWGSYGEGVTFYSEQEARDAIKKYRDSEHKRVSTTVIFEELHPDGEHLSDQ